MADQTPPDMSDDSDHLERAREQLLAAALPHVPFDGWSERTLHAAITETDTDPGLARLAFPRGALDLLIEFHRDLDRRLVAELEQQPADGRIRDRITAAVRRRIELTTDHREAAQRGVALFSLPPYAAHGARTLWRTADCIWSALGDRSRDYNWYSKRAILASVYGATALYWLGDESDGWQSTWDFLDRRIAGVMRFEGWKAAARKSPLASLVLAGPRAVLRCVRAPHETKPDVAFPGTPG